MEAPDQPSQHSSVRLEGYERCKFGMAQVLRTMEAVVPKNQSELHGKIHAAQTRLAEDRFNVAVVGRFSRGKSSLMNAMLHSQRLPTGVEPLTSVITSVSYGSEEKILIHHEGWAFPETAALDSLPSFVTQHGNPGNEKKVQLAEIKMPAELLREGFFFVDTPGLGSPILENTETTQQFLPEIDALILVSGFDDSLDEQEIGVLDAAMKSRRKAFVVLNKQDLVSETDRERICAEVSSRLRNRFNEQAPDIFPLSALVAIQTNSSADVSAASGESGVPHFQEALTAFLLQYKSALILQQMMERLDEIKKSSPEVASTQEITDALNHLRQIVIAFADDRTEDDNNAGWSNERPSLQGSCRICYAMYKRSSDFLHRYQYELLIWSNTQQSHASAGGFCPLHTWQYEAIGSPQGLSASQPPLVNRFAELFRTLKLDNLEAAADTIQAALPTPQTCPVCRTTTEAEQQTLIEVAKALQTDVNSEMTELCVQHVASILRRMNSPEAAQRLVHRTALLLHRTAQDMSRLAIKHEGTRRYMASEEEQKAYVHALLILSGPRSLAMSKGVR